MSRGAVAAEGEVVADGLARRKQRMFQIACVDARGPVDDLEGTRRRAVRRRTCRVPRAPRPRPARRASRGRACRPAPATRSTAQASCVAQKSSTLSGPNSWLRREASNCTRRARRSISADAGAPVAAEPRLHGGQGRRGERLAFDALDERGRHREVVDVLVDPARRVAHVSAKREADAHPGRAAAAATSSEARPAAPTPQGPRARPRTAPPGPTAPRRARPARGLRPTRPSSRCRRQR